MTVGLFGHGPQTARHGDVEPLAPVVTWDLFVVVMGAPYGGDGVSTMMRWVDAAAATGARVQIWTCGYATLLTQRSLGEQKPLNVLDRDARHETTSAWVTRFVTEHEGRTRWLTCRFCSEERGAAAHLDVVRVRPAMAFGRHVRESAKTLFVGVI